MARRREDIAEVTQRVRQWSTEDQAALFEQLLTPELRLRLLIQEMHGHVRVRDERRIDTIVNRAARRVRRGQAASR